MKADETQFAPLDDKGILPPENAHSWAQDANWKTITWSTGKKPLFASVWRAKVRAFHKGKPNDETGWLLLEKRGSETRKSLDCLGRR